MTNVAAAHGKIAIRSEGAFVVAYLSTLDGKEREEIGRIHGLVVRMMPSAWEDWKGVMSRIGVAIIEAAPSPAGDGWNVTIASTNFTGAGTIAVAVGIALLSGTVMSGIPGGGFLGELLIVSLYGFPPQALPVAAMIGTLVDPPATMVNATGDNVVAMMVARVLGGKDWLKKSVE